MSHVSDIRIVIAVLEQRNFTAAALQYGLTGSATAKLVTRVEERLGVKLATRSTRKLTITAEGEVYLSRMRRILADIDEAEEEISSNRSNPRGPLRVSVPNFFFLHQLAWQLPDFQAQYPNVQLELNISDRRVDIVGAGIDVAVRLGPLADSAMPARRICDIYRGLYAAPRYLQAHGVPQTPEDLLGHECLFSNQVQGLDEWPFRGSGGVYRMKVHNRLSLDDSEAIFHGALAGLGIVQISDVLSTGPVQRGELVPLLEEHYNRSPIMVSLMMLPGRQRAARVVAFVDFFVERFGHAPWRGKQATRGTTGPYQRD